MDRTLSAQQIFMLCLFCSVISPLSHYNIKGMWGLSVRLPCFTEETEAQCEELTYLHEVLHLVSDLTLNSKPYVMTPKPVLLLLYYTLLSGENEDTLNSNTHTHTHTTHSTESKLCLTDKYQLETSWILDKGTHVHGCLCMCFMWAGRGHCRKHCRVLSLWLKQ